MKLAAFAPDAAFLPALAKSWLAAGNAASGLLILPNRRAARALAGAFLQANGGKSLLLPRIIALGAIDEAGLALKGALDLPPAVPPMTRQAMLAKLILARGGANGAPQQLHGAWALAGDLAALLDEADAAEIDLRENLPGVVAADLAAHWQTTLQFLDIITHAWPAILAEQGFINPAKRQAALIDAQAADWAQNPPGQKIWLVASHATPALGRLARIIAGLPAGAVILPGYDPAMGEDSWAALEDGHAQHGIASLLGVLGARHEEIRIWPAPPSQVPPGRADLLSAALLPAASLGQWQSAGPQNTAGLSRLEARDEQEDATAIAMVLRAALEIPGRTAALITPDRALAARVTAALKRFGITADDSAGEPLAETPPAVMLRLLAQASAQNFAPLALLALLKHPLTAAGEPPEICRNHARQLEILALRGPRPAPGFAGIKYRLDQPKHQSAKDFLDRLELRLFPVAALPKALNPAEALRALLQAGEALAATGETPGATRLWSGEAGTALAEFFAEALTALADLPDIAPADLPALLDAILAGPVIRKPRTKDGHPRIAIWGVQEAALQTVDVAILGGLVEGVWPAPAEPGPWLSRPMRKAAGLPAAEQKIGQAAHDFFALCCRCPEVILAAPSRRDRAPAIPARWLTRLDALRAGAGAAMPRHEAAAWAAGLDAPDARLPRPKPRPIPPAASRPKKLSISDFATLMADPYAIYARKILGIRELDALDQETDASLFGNIVHKGLEKFFSLDRDFTAPDAAAGLTAALLAAMAQERPRAALEQWWAARLQRMAGWIVSAEAARRAQNPPVALSLEQAAELEIPGGFTLTGRADRIEKRADGSVMIMDYKTGTPPDTKKIEAGTAPQLPLEAVMAEAGAFGPEFCAEVTELRFWKLSGRHLEGEDRPICPRQGALRAVIDTAAAALPAQFAKFANPATPYLAAPHPDRKNFADVYKGISRRGEWGGDGDDDDPA